MNGFATVLQVVICFIIEVNTLAVLKLASDGQFDAQTCKIHDYNHRTCVATQRRSYFPYTGVFAAWVACEGRY